MIWGDSKELNELHKALIGGKTDDWYCVTCSNKMMEVFIELRRKYYQKPMAKQPGKYSFVDENASIRPFGMGEYVNSKNLTDELAQEIIKIDPAYEKLFQVDENFVGPSNDQTPSEQDQALSGSESKPLRVKADYQVRYEELYGAKPDESLTIELLKGAIADKEAEGK
jgi:hypothetical protein